MHFDETGPNTHTRRYWVSATIGIAAMIVLRSCRSFSSWESSLAPRR